MLKHYLYILLALLYSWSLFAQGNGQANIFMDSTTFLIGDQVNMQIIVNAPVGNTVTFPPIGDLLTEEKLELIDQKETEVIKGDVNNTFKKTIILTAWEPGSYQIPAMNFTYPKNNEVVEIKSAAVMVTVTAPQVTGDSTYIADIKTILPEDANFLDWLYYFFTHPVVVAIVILLLAFLGFYAFMQYRKGSDKVIPKTPEEIALERLEALKTDDPLATTDFKAFHTQISFTLRAYINGRFKISALERPTSEIMPQIQPHPLMKADLFEELKTVLEHADLIKFAKASPLDIANKKALQLGFDFVHSVQEILLKKAEEQANK